MKFYIFIILTLFLNLKVLAEDTPFSRVKIKDYSKVERVPGDIAFFDDLDNKYYLEEFEGKTLLLVFWATWCAPCIKELPELDLLKKDFKKLPIEIIAISEDYQGAKLVKEFFSDNNIRHLNIFYDYGNAIFRDMNVNSLPTSFIIDPEGIIKLKIEGGIDWGNEKVREMILTHIPGNYSLPRNSIKDNSLNQTIRIPKLEEDDEEKPSFSNSNKIENIGTITNHDLKIENKPHEALDERTNNKK